MPKFSDIEVIALSLTAECLSIDSENYLFSKLNKEYSAEFKNIISRRQYNDRRKLLFYKTEQVRKLLSERLNRQADVFAIDSMPLEICKIAREQRNKMGKESVHHSPDKGYCASQKKYFYGYKLHSICSLFSNCIITGDKGYIGRQHQINLFETAGIQLAVPLRSNQKEQKPVTWILKKVRKRIETVFSQLCDQFMIQRNYAKSFTGFKSRILAKVAGFTILQFLNQFIITNLWGELSMRWLINSANGLRLLCLY